MRRSLRWFTWHTYARLAACPDQEHDMTNRNADDQSPRSSGREQPATQRSAGDEQALPRGHAQRSGEGSDVADQLRDAGTGGGARSDAGRNVADVDRDGRGGPTATRQQGGGAEGEGME
jgi:hypothetical protein